MHKPNYLASNFYLFSGEISKGDVDWAKKQNILSIGVLNAWAIKGSKPKQVAEQLSKQLKKLV
jgi:glycerophosphoryl diester phosphodiesterase